MLGYTEAVARRCSVKMVFLNFFAEFTGKPLRRSLFFIKIAGLRAAKKGLRHSCFPLNFAKYLKNF